MEPAAITGTKDTHYNLFWFIEKCLSNALRLETFLVDAQRDGDVELVELFERAQADSRERAEHAQQLLAARLDTPVQA